MRDFDDFEPGDKTTAALASCIIIAVIMAGFLILTGCTATSSTITRPTIVNVDCSQPNVVSPSGHAF